MGQLVVRPDGFVDWISEIRSSTSADSVSTKFSSIPLANSPDQWLSSVAHSRVQLHTTVPIGAVDIVTYLESDFLQSADRAPWRWRQYYAEINYKRWSLLGGQAWSLLRPNREGTSSDIGLFNTMVTDPAYHIGLAGARRKQLRLTRSLDHGNAASVEWESGGRFLGRFSHDGPRRRLHLEATVFGGTQDRIGVGFSQGVDVRPWLRLVGAQFVSRGGGTETLSIIPPGVKAASFIEGVEMTFHGGDRTIYSYGGMAYGEYSGGNRYARQYSVGVQKRMAHGPIGTVMWNTQFTQMDRALWDGRGGALTFVMTGFRYLPPIDRQ